MKCPKCQIGDLRKVQFVRTGSHAHLCNYCGTMWNDADEINELNGVPLETLESDNHQYVFIDEEKQDDDAPHAIPRI